MRVLGIDPGSRHLGWAVIQSTKGRVSLKASGLIKTEGAQGPSLGLIYDELAKVVKKYQPRQVAMESIFFNRNISSAVKVGEARGVVILLAHQNGMETTSYTPQQIKKEVSGSGRAEKQEVDFHVQEVLGLEESLNNPHVADACAIAWCHLQKLNHSKSLSRIKEN